MAFKFTHEDLDALYDEAMAWEPPVTAPVAGNAPADARGVLQKLITQKQANITNSRGQQING